MKATLFFGLLIASSTVAAQDEHQIRIKQELVEWDAVRGEWLAESFQAMANQQPIPDRTFAEDLTPAELFSMVPQDRQQRIRDIANESRNPRENTRTPEPPQNNNGQIRVPVGGTPNQPQQPSSNDRYYDYFRPVGCNLVMGRSYGDPHIKTFDGRSYSFQTVGEYILSASPDRLFEVQARQKPQTDKVSLNTAVAMNVYGDRVGIYASDHPDRNGATPLRVNGNTVYLSNETYFLPRGGTIQNNGKEYIITWPTGEKVQAKLASTGGMPFLNLSVYVQNCKGNYYGLLGNANGIMEDDFNGNNGRILASSTIFDPFDSRTFGRTSTTIEREHLAFLAKDFGGRYLVNDMTSLFDYPFGASSWTFYDPSFPRTYITMADISQSDRDRARRECERQGIRGEDMNGCVMDLAHGNIPPTVRPTTPDRTTGRTLETVTTRTPNINRPDIYNRTRTPENDNGSIRTPQNAPNNDRVTPGSTRMPIENGSVDRQNSTLSAPSTPATPTRKPVENSSVDRQNGTLSAPSAPATPTRKPVGNSSMDRQKTLDKRR